jgi:hypothetical protein
MQDVRALQLFADYCRKPALVARHAIPLNLSRPGRLSNPSPSYLLASPLSRELSRRMHRLPCIGMAPTGPLVNICLL